MRVSEQKMFLLYAISSMLLDAIYDFLGRIECYLSSDRNAVSFLYII